jgi:hypothetical protein
MRPRGHRDDGFETSPVHSSKRACRLYLGEKKGSWAYMFQLGLRGEVLPLVTPELLRWIHLSIDFPRLFDASDLVEEEE